MKSVLISIQPKWVEKIASGEKPTEVRKTRPKIETPFKCYIYCTKGKEWEKTCFGQYTCHIGKGKVIGEFVCDKIVQFENSFYEPSFEETSRLSCVGYDELAKYLGKHDYGYGWHISDLKIYDKPKELSEFWTIKCTNKRNGCLGCEVKPNCIKTITRPPQSYMFVESLGE